MSITKQISDLTKENTLNDIIEEQDSPAENLERTSSVSTFTRHTNKVHAIIKEILMGLIIVILAIEGFKK